MTRIQFPDLPLLQDLSPEQLKELFGAGRFRPEFEQLESRLVPAISLSQGVLSVVGADPDDKITVAYNPFDPTRVDVTHKDRITNTTLEYELYYARDIQFMRLEGLGGQDEIVNQTAIASFLDGGMGDDILQGGSADDRLEGGRGNDTYRFASINQSNFLGRDVVFEPYRGGSDTLDFSQYNQAINIDLSSTYEQTVSVHNELVGSFSLLSKGATLLPRVDLSVTLPVDPGFGRENVENVIGTSFNDTMTGSLRANVLEGRGGNDTYRLRAGWADHDIIKEDSVSGQADLLDFSLAPYGVGITLDLGNSSVQTINDAMLATVELQGLGIENVTGSGWDDVLSGNSANNRILGLGGNDQLEGRGGDDFLGGGAGSDTYVFAGGNLGHDFIDEAADADADTLDFSRLDSGVYNELNYYGMLELSSTATQSVNLDLDLTLSSSTGIENVRGSQFQDMLAGNDRNNIIWGEGGDDYILGRKGDDELHGGEGRDAIGAFRGAFGGTQAALEEGNDVLFGDDGNDRLFGGLGRDVIHGGSGDDYLGGGFEPAPPGAAVVDSTEPTTTEVDQLFGEAGHDTLIQEWSYQWKQNSWGLWYQEKIGVDQTDYVGWSWGKAWDDWDEIR